MNEVRATSHTNPVVESRTSMVDGTSPSNVVNNPTKEDQDRLAAALALTALPDGVRVLPNPREFTPNSQENLKMAKNGFQHIPVQSVPAQPGRNSVGRAVAKPKQATKQPSSTAFPTTGLLVETQSNEKKKTNRAKKASQDKSRVPKTLTIAQYLHKQTTGDSGAKIRPGEPEGADKQYNDDTTNLSVCSGSGQPTRQKPSAKKFQSGVPLKHEVSMKPYESRGREVITLAAVSPRQQSHTVIGLTVVTSASKLGHAQNVPLHVLPAPMTTVNRGVAQPSVHNGSQHIGNRPKSQFIFQPVLSTNTSNMRPTIVTVSRQGMISNRTTTGATGIPQSNSSDVTSVDISTLNLPTNTPAGMNKERVIHQSHLNMLPKTQAHRKGMTRPKRTPTPQQQGSSHSERSKELLSELALSNIEDKNKPLSVQQMLSVSALSYLQSSSGPVKMPNFPVSNVKLGGAGLTRDSGNSTFNASLTPSSSKKLSLPMAISEGPPTRSSLMNTPGMSATGPTKSGGKGPFDDMFPLSNHNPLLPRVFHSFLPTKNDAELQPTDLSVKKPTSSIGKGAYRNDNRRNDQPQDLSISRNKDQPTGKPTPSPTPTIGVDQTQIIVSQAKASESPKGKTTNLSSVNSLSRVTSGHHTTVGVTLTSTSMALMATSVNTVGSSKAPNSENLSMLNPMPPLVPGIPLPVLQTLIAQQRAGAIASQHVQGTTVESLPAVIMSTGKNLQGSAIGKSGPIVTTAHIGKSKQVVTTVDTDNRGQLQHGIAEHVPGKQNDKTKPGSTGDVIVKGGGDSKMIGTCPGGLRGRDADMPLHSDIERNKLPPKKRKLLYEDLHTDEDVGTPPAKQQRTSHAPDGAKESRDDPGKRVRDSPPQSTGSNVAADTIANYNGRKDYKQPLHINTMQGN